MRSLEASRGISQVVMASLSTMESDAVSFREHLNASSEKHDQGLSELAEAYEVDPFLIPSLASLFDDGKFA